jgi:GMP synthase-like glutamine amidotransferase
VRVLSVTHGPSVPGGVFDEAVEASGHALERWVVPLGGTPQPAASYDCVMVFGGSMHPDEDDHFAWLEREAEFLQETLAADVPVLGVCLGAQMLARAAGAWVGPAPASEVGWFEVELTPAGRSDPVLGVLPPRTHAFQWHHYTYAVPDGGTELARSEACTQAFRLGRAAWGLQFHAEMTLPMLRAWVAEEPVELPAGPEAFLEEAEARIEGWNEQGRALCRAFLAVAAASDQEAGGATSSTTSFAADA